MIALSSNDKLRGSALVLVSGMCWGFHGVIIKFAYSFGASFQQVFFAEATIATLFFSCFARSFAKSPRPHASRHWVELGITSVATVGLGSLLFLSFSLGPIAIGATLLFLYLPLVYGYSVLSGAQPFTIGKGISILLLLAGACITTEIGSALSGGALLPAILSGAGAAVCYATIFALTPRISAYTTATFRSFILSLAGMLGSALILLIVPETRHSLSQSWPPLLAIFLILGVIGQILPVITLMKGIPMTGSSLAGVLASTELPVAVIASALILGESITFEQGLGVAIVLLGIVIFNLEKPKTT